MDKMTAKEEFYNLISHSFSEIQISSIENIIKEFLAKLADPGKADPTKAILAENAFFYDLCALFYNSAKNYENFTLNLANKELPLDYTTTVLKREDEEQQRAFKCYENTRYIIEKFIKKNDEFTVVNPYALTNAIVPEILSQEQSKNQLSRYQDYEKLMQIKNKIKNGQRITRISFDLDTVPAATIGDVSTISTFWHDLIRYSSYRFKAPTDLQTEIEKLKSQTSQSINRIALRICMILVRYNVLSSTTSSPKYVLVNENNEYVSLSQNIMYKIHLLLDTLGQEFKERENECGSETNTKSFAEKVKNLLRNGKKGINDDFKYSDISETYLGCFRNEF